MHPPRAVAASQRQPRQGAVRALVLGTVVLGTVVLGTVVLGTVVLVAVVPGVQCLDQPGRVVDPQRRLAHHQRLAVGVRQRGRREAPGQDRDELHRIGSTVEQRQQRVTLADRHRLEPTEDLHRLTGRDDPAAVQLAHPDLAAGGAFAHVLDVAGAHVTQRHALAGAHRDHLVHRAFDQQPLRGQQALVVR